MNLQDLGIYVLWCCNIYQLRICVVFKRTELAYLCELYIYIKYMVTKYGVKSYDVERGCSTLTDDL